MNFSFWGGPSFSVTVLKVLLEHNLQPALIVTTPPASQGRKQELVKNELQVLAEENDIPVLTPSKLKDSNFLETLNSYGCDFHFLTAYGKMVPQEVLDARGKGFVNLHPSLLPKYRGASPIQTAILNGEKTTGVSLFLMDQGMDDGPILRQKSVPIEVEDTYPSLSQKLAVLGAKLALETLPEWLEGICTPEPQDASEATFTTKFTTLDGQINWEVETAQSIVLKVKALAKEPGVFSYYKEDAKSPLVVKLYDIQLDSTAMDSLGIGTYFPGKIIKQDNKLLVMAKEGLIEVKSLQPAGKKIMTAQAFLNGHANGSFISNIEM
ncbi:MAG TPA: methionyl-tRNA formyltransferase [Candidatus Paceibacterota bacterium]|nr:methionyl-tRNA formyltransferase [Candidatus Paceibacterota bacterium]